MAQAPRVTLEQWRALQAVVEAGGYAQAAEAIHKSQSTLTYAVQKIESLLEVKVFELRGRKAVLTEAGQVLYRRARTLLEEASALERGAAAMSEDWQPEIAIAVDIVFPTWLLVEALAEFAKERPETRIEVYETVLQGTREMLEQGRVDFAIGSHQGGVEGESVLVSEAVAVAHPKHPLHHLGRKVTARDLRNHRRIFIRDTAAQREKEVEGVELRWTVSHKATQIRALTLGLGVAWIPRDNVREELAAGTLKALPMAQGGTRRIELFLQFSDAEFPGRDAMRLADILRERAGAACRKQRAGRA